MARLVATSDRFRVPVARSVSDRDPAAPFARDTGHRLDLQDAMRRHAVPFRKRLRTCGVRA
jgi:hypothetical protein